MIELFAQPLQQARIGYFISGSVASMLYGEPRVTHDIGLVVFLRANDATRLEAIFPPPVFYVPPEVVILEEMSRDRRGHFNIIHAGRDELHAWAFSHARTYTIGASTISLAPPEYVILRKLEYYREGGSEKHLRDIRSMLAISGEELDRNALHDWVARRGFQPEWRQVSE